jgi:hypothetical protein
MTAVFRNHMFLACSEEKLMGQARHSYLKPINSLGLSYSRTLSFIRQRIKKSSTFAVSIGTTPTHVWWLSGLRRRTRLPLNSLVRIAVTLTTPFRGTLSPFLQCRLNLHCKLQAYDSVKYICALAKPCALSAHNDQYEGRGSTKAKIKKIDVYSRVPLDAFVVRCLLFCFSENYFEASSCCCFNII